MMDGPSAASVDATWTGQTRTRVSLQKQGQG